MLESKCDAGTGILFGADQGKLEVFLSSMFFFLIPQYICFGYNNGEKNGNYNAGLKEHVSKS